jgi:Spy/CpxP family protein refolding chaperone
MNYEEKASKNNDLLTQYDEKEIKPFLTKGIKEPNNKLKNYIMKTTLFIAAVLFLGQVLQAQPGRARMDRGQGMRNYQECQMIPELTEAQKEEIQSLRVAHLKDMQDYRNQVDENRARYRTLVRAMQTDQKAIDANIDEYTGLRNQMMKKQTTHQQQIRNLLTDDQKVFFDNRGMRGRQGAGMRGRGMQGPRGRW